MPATFVSIGVQFHKMGIDWFIPQIL